MKRNIFEVFALLTLALLVPAIATAHHSHNNLDRNDVRVYSGVVSKYGWVNPHVYLKIMAPSQQGKVVEHVVAMLFPGAMAERGWSKDTFKPGDRITWQGHHDRNPNRHYTGLQWVEKEDGTRLINGIQKRKAKIKVLPSSDFTGMWKRSSTFGWTYYPPKGWPLTKIGQLEVDNFDPADNPQLNCIEPGPPRGTVLPYPVVITRPDDKTIVLTGELWLGSKHRLIHLDRDHPPGLPSRFGHSIGWFEGDELVVETKNFTASPWGNYVGIGSSEQKHLIERFSLVDGGTNMRILMTLTDPVYLTEAVEIDYLMNKIADRKSVSAPCSREAAVLFLQGHGDGN